MSKHPYRWQCSVPGCRCTIGAHHAMDSERGDWALCRKHWPLVPRAMKQAIRRVLRRHQVAYAKGRHETDGYITFSTREEYLAEQRARTAYDRLARRIVRYACERALGIA